VLLRLVACAQRESHHPTGALTTSRCACEPRLWRRVELLTAAVASRARLAQAVKIDPTATVEAGEGSQAESTVPVANTAAENDVKAADSQLDNTASAANADNSLNRNA